MKNGDIYKTNNFGNIKIINYINSRNVLVEFVETGYLTRTCAVNIRKGGIKDVMRPSVYGVGYVGAGTYTSKSKTYGTWSNMIRRCYAKDSEFKYPTYMDCSVSEDWHNFQVFAEWYGNNYRDGYDLDKDLLVVGNKIYSSDTCIFVPPSINCFTVNQVRSRGDYPTGVHYNKRLNKYIAQCGSRDGTKRHLGCFLKPDQAYLVWRGHKLNLASEMKSEMDAIDKRIYNNVVTIINNSYKEIQSNE